VNNRTIRSRKIWPHVLRDYKYSGEHRVRLDFDGSRQSATTCSVTYAPTVRAESVLSFIRSRIWMANSAIRCSPGVFKIKRGLYYPPKGQSEFPGQLLKLAKMLYGSKQPSCGVMVESFEHPFDEAGLCCFPHGSCLVFTGVHVR
jgi:hypothetical protein